MQFDRSSLMPGILLNQHFTLRVLVMASLLAQQWCLAQTLPELIDGVLSTHPSIRSQRAQGESAKQAVEGAEWQFYPTPSVGFEQVDATRADPSYPSYGDKNVTTLRLQQPLWTGGRLTAGLDKAHAGLLASQAALEGTRQDLALRVVQAYADWLGAVLKRQAYEKSLQAHAGLQAQIQRRIANGVSPQSDLALLLGRAQQTEADLWSAKAQEQSALQRLSQLLGRPLQAQDLLRSVSPAQSLPQDVLDLMQQAQVHNPGIAKLQAQARIAQAEISEREADLLPEAYLRAERQYGNYAYANTSPVNRYFIGFSSHFGAGLSSLTQLSGAQARYEAALAEVDASRINLGEQIQTDHAQAQAGLTRLKALQASLEASDNIARAWSRQFVAGRKSWLDVMNAVREQAQLEAQIGEAKAAQLLLSWRLAIVGRGLESTLAAPLAGQPLAAAEVAPPADLRPPTPPYPQTPNEAIALRAVAAIDPLGQGTELGQSPRPSDTPSPPISKEASW